MEEKIYYMGKEIDLNDIDFIELYHKSGYNGLVMLCVLKREVTSKYLKTNTMGLNFITFPLQTNDENKRARRRLYKYIIEKGQNHTEGIKLDTYCITSSSKRIDGKKVKEILGGIE